MVNQFSEIGPNSKERISVSRMDVEHNGYDSSIVCRKKVKLDSYSERLDTENNVYEKGEGERTSLVDREAISNKTAVSCRKSLLNKLECPENKRGKELNLDGISKTNKKCVKRTPMVAESNAAQCAGESMCNPTSGGVVDRCIPIRLGSLHTMGRQRREKERIDGSWPLEQRMELESERADSSTACTTPLLQPSPNIVDKALENTLRQHSDSVQFEQVCSSEKSSQSNEEIIQLCVGKTVNLGSDLHKRDEECKGGQPLEVEQSGRLLIRDVIANTHIGVVEGEDSMRFVCDQSESETPDILHIVTERQPRFCQRRLQCSLESVGCSISSSSSAAVVEEPTKDPEGESESSGGSSILVGSAVVTDIKDHVDTDSSDGGVEVFINPRSHNAKAPRQATTRSAGGISGGRVNDKGEQMVLRIIQNAGLTGCEDWFFKSMAPTTLRNYRRGFTAFSNLLQETSFQLEQLTDKKLAATALVEVLRIAFEKKFTVSAVSLMRTAMIRLFSFVFDEDFSKMKVFQVALKYYKRDKLPKKDVLHLKWSIEDLFRYLMTLAPFEDLPFEKLVGVTLVLCIVFTALRYTEIQRLSMETDEPDLKEGYLKLWTQVKGHEYLEPVFLHVMNEPRLDPVAALMELKRRIKEYDQKEKHFWCKVVDGKLETLSYNEIRKVVIEVLAEAGIDEKHPYHIKHAVLTCLDKNGASAREIATFARHRFESMTAYKHYLSSDRGKKSVTSLVDEIKN
jgi:site-specific recombinase XerD